MHLTAFTEHSLCVKSSKSRDTLHSHSPRPRVTRHKQVQVTEQEEVQLPVATKAKLVRQMLVQEKKGFIQVLCDLGERQTPVPKPISSARP